MKHTCTHILAMFRYILRCHNCSVCVHARVCLCTHYWFLVGRGGGGGGSMEREMGRTGRVATVEKRGGHKTRREREGTGKERRKASHRCWIQPDLNSPRPRLRSDPFPVRLSPFQMLLCSHQVAYDSLRPRALSPARLLLSLGFLRQECWRGLLRPSPGPVQMGFGYLEPKAS